MSGPWSDARVEQLRNLVAEKLTFSQIAAVMGPPFTRLACCGKANRLGLVSLSAKNGRFSTNPIGRLPRTSPPPMVKPKPIPAYDAKRPLVALLDLEERHCRFPVGEPSAKTFGFCGHDRRLNTEGVFTPSLPYCQHHHKVAYVPRSH